MKLCLLSLAIRTPKGSAARDPGISQTLGCLFATSERDNNQCGRVQPPSLLLAVWETVKVVSKSPWEYVYVLNTEF